MWRCRSRTGSVCDAEIAWVDRARRKLGKAAHDSDEEEGGQMMGVASPSAERAGLGSWLFLWRRARFQRIRTPARPRSGVQRALIRRCIRAKDGTPRGVLFFFPQPNAPIVVMAPGLGGRRTVPRELRRGFVNEGVGGAAFAYRCFGGSEGETRHWVDPARHVEDTRRRSRSFVASSR